MDKYVAILAAGLVFFGLSLLVQRVLGRGRQDHEPGWSVVSLAVFLPSVTLVLLLVPTASQAFAPACLVAGAFAMLVTQRLRDRQGPRSDDLVR